MDTGKYILDNMEMKENKEIITDPKIAREEVKKWCKSDFGIFQKEVVDYFNAVREEYIKKLVDSDEIWSAYLLRFEKKEKIRLNGIVIGSTNEEKKAGISKVAEEQRRSIVPLSQEVQYNENENQKKFKEKIKKGISSENFQYTVRSYVMDMAERKALETSYIHQNETIISSDVVVLKGEEIFEKPKSNKEVFEMIKKLSGQDVQINIGVVMLMNTKIDREIFLKRGIILTVKLKNFSDEDIKKYIEKAGDKIFNISGGIDYTNLEESGDLIDKDKPIKVESLNFEKVNSEPILFSPKMLSSFSDYLHGVPKELIEEMIVVQKNIQEELN